MNEIAPLPVSLVLVAVRSLPLAEGELPACLSALLDEARTFREGLAHRDIWWCATVQDGSDAQLLAALTDACEAAGLPPFRVVAGKHVPGLDVRYGKEKWRGRRGYLKIYSLKYWQVVICPPSDDLPMPSLCAKENQEKLRSPRHWLPEARKAKCFRCFSRPRSLNVKKIIAALALALSLAVGTAPALAAEGAARPANPVDQFT